MVEERFGYELVDKLIVESKLPSKGVYTAVGTYDFAEMVVLITGLSEHTGLEISFLLKEYGFHFFDVLQKSYPQFLDRTKTAFQFLASIENHIHVEVQKLYPEAELPTFDTNLFTPGHLEMVYRSERSMADFAEGLIEKSLEYYEEEAEIIRQNIEEDGSVVKFILKQND